MASQNGGPLTVRAPTATEDLTELWPEPVVQRCDREQMLVVADGPRLVGGCLLWDGGHALVFVGDFRIAKTSRPTRVGKALLSGLLEWCRKRDRAGVLFQVTDVRFAALLLHVGARSCGQAILLTRGTDPLPWEREPAAAAGAD